MKPAPKDAEIKPLELPELSGSQVRKRPLTIGDRCPSITTIVELDKNLHDWEN